MGEVQVRNIITSQKWIFSTNKNGLLVTFFQVYDGYFVHYFAPRGLPVVPKDVIFVIDVSGSMIGTKIKQVKWTNLIDSMAEKTHSQQGTFVSNLSIPVSRPSRP